MSDGETRVLGFRASGGPLYQASIRIQPGLTVLYGLNGSGKTHILDALHSVLSGRRVGLDGRYVSPHVEAALLLHAPEERFARWRSRSSHGDGWREWHRNGIATLDSELRPLHRQVEDEEAWEVTAPEPRALTPLWRIRRAATPRPGTPAGRVFQAESIVWSEWINTHYREEEEVLGAEERFEAMARALRRPALGHLDAFDWGEGVFLSPGGAVFHNEDVLPDPAMDGLPLPVMGLGEVSLENGFGPPIPGLRVVVESSDPEASNHLTRESIGNLREGSRLPTAFGWVKLPSEADVFAADTWFWEVLGLAVENAESWRSKDAARVVSIGTKLFLDSYLDVLEGLVNELYQRFLLDAPALSLVRDDRPVASCAGRGLEWQSEGRHLAALSTAQRRWAGLAVALSLEATLSAPTYASRPTGLNLAFQPNSYVILDEPEASLHRTAEAHMVQGLEWLARQSGMHVILATHSPHVMDSRDAHVARVHRRRVRPRWGGERESAHISPLTGPHRRDLESLGIVPSDLLRRTRVFLLVEGQHDEIVCHALLSRVLPPGVLGRLYFLPVRGGSKLPAAVESRLLFDFTEATVVPLVDNIRAERVTSVWERTLVLAATEGDQSAGEFLRTQLPAGQAAENGFLAQFLSRAMALGVQSRVSPFSLPAVDVTDYLPVGAFVPKVKSWDDLRGTYRSECESGTTRLTSFKAWVEKKYRTDFSDDRIRRALAQIEGCPEDFRALADLCARLCE